MSEVPGKKGGQAFTQRARKKKVADFFVRSARKKSGKAFF